MTETLKNHWPEYFIEAWCLGAFMVSACVFSVALFHPASPVIGINGGLRMVIMGVAMGATATGIICSPWGKRSGAHFNPAVTLTFLRLGKITRTNAAFYVLSHFVGGALGVVIVWIVFGSLLADSAVNFAVTIPGEYGTAVAFIAEIVISFLMMTMILWTSNSRRLSSFTPYLAGVLVAIFISIESPVSGMSMNPARTFASAAVAGNWTASWIYFVAPPLAMLAAAEVFVKMRGLKTVLCAKLHHHNRARCIFNCGYKALATQKTEKEIQPQMAAGNADKAALKSASTA
jgi:aquaporin Z